MKPNRQLVLGKALVAIGCVWFFLALFRIRPLFVSLFYFLAWLRLPAGIDEILTVINGREYITALATFAVGVIVWRRAAIGRWPLRLIVIALALSIVGVAVPYELKKQAGKRREAGYQTTLQSYAEVLKPGMSRKEVEDYLRAKNMPLRQMCCVEAGTMSDRSSLDDLVKIGEENAPWFCSENNVYIAFQFADHERRHGVGFTTDDLDRLKSVTVYRWLEGCL